MTLAKRLVSTPTGKKNDDPVEGATRPVTSKLLILRGPRKRRILLSIAALIAVYLFIKYLPTDLPPVSHRSYDSRYGLLRPGGPSTTTSPVDDGQEAPPRPQGAVKERYFDGPVKFYHLTSTLYRSIVPRDNARNVLFGISNIKSASNVLPMACGMAKRQRNRVHVAVFGRQDIAIQTIQEIYGISDTDCPVSWEDARPDFPAYSSDERMEVSVRASLSHIFYHLKPHAIITDTPDREDHYFVGAVREASSQAQVPVITLPDPAVERLGWLCELDGTSLGDWNKLQIEILVHASATSSASFIRLLKSIENADYTGTAYPRITVELPEITDHPTLDFLSTFRWPPSSSESESKMIVRRRLSSKHLTPVEASLRTVESFYSVHADRSHVLVLTSDAELSPSYFGYLKFLLLEYRYSNPPISSEPAAKLIGISLESPSQLLNGSDLDLTDIVQSDSAPLFLWQAPNSHAALYFGDKWVEFHSFLSHRYATGLDISTAISQAGEVSKKHPAWLRYLLEFARAREYYVLYPVVKTGGYPLVTIHNELYQSPIELSETQPSAVPIVDKPTPIDWLETEVLIGGREQQRSTRPEPVTRNTESQISLLLTALANTTLPRLQSLPHLSYNAVLVTPERSQQLSVDFATRFSLELGGCKSLQDRVFAAAWTADDLFCSEDAVV